VDFCDSEAPVPLAPHEGEPSTGPLRQGELLGAISSPQSCHARSPVAGTTMILRRRGEATTRTTRHVALVDRRAGVSPLHDSSGDGSLSEETPISPAFCLLMQLSFRSRLAIWRFLCCALCVAHRFSATTLFRLKIASFGRGAFAGTRCVHFNYNCKKA
jgi:hypothetical protein